MQDIAANLARIRENIAVAAVKSGRKPEEITMVAVTKTVDVAQVEEAWSHGVTDIGENRVQELLRKYDFLGSRVKWHLIGHLQTNKVKYLLDKVDLIHSLDRLSLAREIQSRAEINNRPVNVLVQVNISGEESKFGLERQAALDFIAKVADNYPLVRIKGLMTMAPFTAEPETTRPVFRGLRELGEEARERISGIELRHLSMGMTNDYTVAIEEGADIIRIGTAIFGVRAN